MKKTIFLAIIVFLIIINIIQFLWDRITYPLYKDAIPDEKTALAIGIAVLIADNEEHFNTDDYSAIYLPQQKAWYVGNFDEDPNYAGASTRVIIRKRDGKILRLNRFM